MTVGQILKAQEDILKERILAAIYEFNIATGCFLNEIEFIYSEDETISSIETGFTTDFESVKHTDF